MNGWVAKLASIDKLYNNKTYIFFGSKALILNGGNPLRRLLMPWSYIHCSSLYSHLMFATELEELIQRRDSEEGLA